MSEEVLPFNPFIGSIIYNLGFYMFQYVYIYVCTYVCMYGMAGIGAWGIVVVVGGVSKCELCS